MTFLDLQRKIVQTRKARQGVANRRDYFKDVNLDEEVALNAIYKRALRTANEVVKHYEIAEEFDPEEKISIVFGKKPNEDENQTLEQENEKLKAEITSLKKELEDFKGKFKSGGRKGYDATMAEQVRNARSKGETWRGLAAKLGISPTTAQKLYHRKK